MEAEALSAERHRGGAPISEERIGRSVTEDELNDVGSLGALLSRSPPLMGGAAISALSCRGFLRGTREAAERRARGCPPGVERPQSP